VKNPTEQPIPESKPLVAEEMRNETQEECERFFNAIKDEIQDTVNGLERARIEILDGIVQEFNDVNPDRYANNDITYNGAFESYNQWKYTFSPEKLAEYAVTPNMEREYEELEHAVRQYLQTNFTSASVALQQGQIVEDTFQHIIQKYVVEITNQENERHRSISGQVIQMEEDSHQLVSKINSIIESNDLDTDVHAYNRRVRHFTEHTEDYLTRLRHIEQNEADKLYPIMKKFSENVLMPYIGMYAVAERQAKLNESSIETKD
jgi:hypothetical protein